MTDERAAREIEALYSDELPRRAGVVHVASVWSAPDGARFNMRIGPETPKSPTDAFVLSLARARADAIVTTGRILREEPLLGSADFARDRFGLEAWRRDAMGRVGPPLVVVLSRGVGIDLGHPVFAAGPTLIWTGEAAAADLAPQAEGRGIEVIGRAAPGLLDAIHHLRADRGLESVVVEAGPSTSAVLYEKPGDIDELMLSQCHAATLPDGVRGRRFPRSDTLERVNLCEQSRVTREEPSGR